LEIIREDLHAVADAQALEVPRVLVDVMQGMNLKPRIFITFGKPVCKKFFFLFENRTEPFPPSPEKRYFFLRPNLPLYNYSLSFILVLFFSFLRSGLMFFSGGSRPHIYIFTS
jgi:hypothetical protein